MPGLRVVTANRLEALADRLAAVVARPLGSPLERETIVVRNPGMERWVTLALARRLGIWANAHFPLPNAFLDELFRDSVGEAPSESWKPEVLAWRIQRLLPELLDLPQMAPLRAYLGAGDASGLKRWQLASRIADLFDQYLVYRPDWIEEWRRGRPAARPSPHADWQALLLRRLWDEDRGSDRALIRRRFLDALEREPAGGTRLPRRVSVFGIAALPPFHLEALAALACHVEVNIFLLNPSREFWFESMTDRRYLRLRGRAAAPGLQPQQRDALPSATNNPLLASLGGLGGEVFRMLLDAEPGEEEAIFREPEGQSLLARLQRAILDDAPLPAPGAEQAAVDPEDCSLQVHSCHGPMREIEVLRDRLLALLDADPTLLPEEIAVMAPEIETYVPYIEAVFRRGAQPLIPYNLSDRRVARESSLARAFLATLQMPRLRFAAPEVLDILESEPARARLGLTEGDLGAIRKWVAESGIRWGIDGGDRERLGLPRRDENTWRFGLRRLLLGTALEEPRVYAGVLPLPPRGERETLAAFVDFVERLAGVVVSLRQPRPLAAWAESLRLLLAELFAEAGDTRGLLAEIGRLADCQRLSGFDGPVSVDVIAWLLGARLEQAGPGHGFLTEGVTFCSLLPMRSIPFRVICLLGMDFGAFPRADAAPGFDLMAREPKPGDRSRRDDDRYLFLETLVSARDALYISYVGRSASDGTPRAPSVVVSELLDDVRRRFRLGRDFPVEHPLHDWSPRCFDGSDPQLFSYSPDALAAARAARGDAAAPARLFLGKALPQPEPDPAGLRLEDLLAFYRSPARFLLERRLEISLEERVVEIETREPFAVSGLDRYRLQSDLLERCLAGADPQEARAALRAGGGLPHGTAGELELEWLEAEVLEFLRLHGDELRPETRATVPIDVAVASTRLVGSLELWDGRLLRYRFAAAKAHDRLGLWIRHLAAFRAGVAAGPSRLLASDGATTLEPPADTSALDDLVRWYQEGLCLPLPFFPRTSLAFAETLAARGDESAAMAAARKAWLPDDEWNRGRGEAEEPSIRQLFAASDPLREPFRRLATGVYGPMLGSEVRQ